jgi:hypothetical protein
MTKVVVCNATTGVVQTKALDAVEKVVTSSSLPPLSVTFPELIAAIRGEPAR